MFWQPSTVWQPAALQSGAVIFFQESTAHQQILIVLETGPTICPSSKISDPLPLESKDQNYLSSPTNMLNSYPCLLCHERPAWKRWCFKARLMACDPLGRQVVVRGFEHLTFSEPQGLFNKIIIGFYIVEEFSGSQAVDYYFRVCQAFCHFASVDELVGQHQPWLWQLTLKRKDGVTDLQRISLGVRPYTRISVGRGADQWEDITETVGNPLLLTAETSFTVN